MTDLTLIQRTTGTISKNDFIVCRKNAKPQQGGGGAKPKAYPLMRLSQTARQRKSERKKKEKRGEGKGERKSL